MPYKDDLCQVYWNRTREDNWLTKDNLFLFKHVFWHSSIPVNLSNLFSVKAVRLKCRISWWRGSGLVSFSSSSSPSSCSIAFCNTQRGGGGWLTWKKRETLPDDNEIREETHGQVIYHSVFKWITLSVKPVAFVPFKEHVWGSVPVMQNKNKNSLRTHFTYIWNIYFGD